MPESGGRSRSGAAERRLRSWIDRHMQSFMPSVGAAPIRFKQVKPLAELALVLWALPPGPVTGSGRSSWVGRSSRILRKATTALAARHPWTAHEPSTDWLMVFPILERTTGHRFAGQSALRSALAAGSNSFNVAFARDMAGLEDCRPTVHRELGLLQSAWYGDDPGQSTLYRLTHLVFFATLFGRRAGHWSGEQQRFLADVLGPCAQARLVRGDYDIAAELLVAMAWVGLAQTSSFSKGTKSLASLALAQGSIPADERALLEGQAFEHRYHATLMTLLALAEEISYRGEG